MDWNAVLSQAVIALVPVVTMVVVSGIRALVSKIPRLALPILAVALPFALTLLTNYIGGHQFSPLVGALLGAAATWLREVITTMQQHGTSA
jgi:ABC-type glycerol-3-phosphate transport system permease component